MVVSKEDAERMAYQIKDDITAKYHKELQTTLQLTQELGKVKQENRRLWDENMQFKEKAFPGMDELRAKQNELESVIMANLRDLKSDNQRLKENIQVLTDENKLLREAYEEMKKVVDIAKSIAPAGLMDAAIRMAKETKRNEV